MWLGSAISPAYPDAPAEPSWPQANSPAELDVVYELTEGALSPPIQIICLTMFNKSGRVTETWGMPPGLNCIHYNSEPGRYLL